MTGTVCKTCGCGPLPENGSVTVYRENAKGGPPVWACREHRSGPSEVQDLVDALEGILS